MASLAGPSRARGDHARSPYGSPRAGSASDDAASDWLEHSDEELEVAADAQQKQHDKYNDAAILSRNRRMGERDMDKVQRKLYDEGYREGISAGKEAMIQPAFDKGYATTGVPAGRALGQVKGTLHALTTMLAQHRARTSATDSKQDDTSATSDDLLQELAALRRDTYALRIDDIIAPDYEAFEHEREHAGEDAVASARDQSSLQRETPEQTRAREQRVPKLQERVNRLEQRVLAHVTAPPSSHT